MEDLRLSAVATRVVAWHNRHPLARRITASQVHAIGYVALPFSDPSGTLAAPAAEAEPADAEGGTLRQRAQARARQQDAAAPGGVPTVTQLAVDPKSLVADFSEDFIDPLSPRQVARFARRRGRALVRAPSDGPMRRIRADGRNDGAGLTLYLLTAVIETGTWKSRVLIGAGDKPAVLGRRVLAPARSALVLAPLLATAWLYHPSHQAPAAQVPVVAAAASAASAAALPAPPPAPASAPAAAEPAATAQAAASAPEPIASAPLDVEPRLGRIEMPSIRPRLGGVRAASAPAAREPAVAQAPAASAAAVAAAPAARPPVAPPPAVAPEEPAFALSTRPLRTRAEADQVRIAMKSLLRAITSEPVRVDIMAEGDDWRVVGLPFATQAEADKARALLLSRGMRVVVVGF